MEKYFRVIQGVICLKSIKEVVQRSTSESDCYRGQILTSKVDPLTVRVNAASIRSEKQMRFTTSSSSLRQVKDVNGSDQRIHPSREEVYVQIYSAVRLRYKLLAECLVYF